MRRLVGCLVMAVACTGMLVRSAQAEVTAEEVRQAIQNGVDYLKTRQKADGSWPESTNQPGGVTALVTLALLYCGEKPDAPHVAKALDYLEGIEPTRTYAASLQTMVFAKAAPDRYKRLIQRNANWLARTQLNNEFSVGDWTYGYDLQGALGDNSNSQFALLALHEAERAGAKVDPVIWQRAKECWRNCQNPDGSWSYSPLPRKREVRQANGVRSVKVAVAAHGDGTGSMTCAGITSLIIANGALYEGDARVVGDRIQCCVRGDSADDPCIQNGLKWLADNFSVAHNPGNNSWLLYYLYGMERVGRMTAQRFIGGHDWYREGADQLLRMKGCLADAWDGGMPVIQELVVGEINTSFALLFLSKGRRPILLAKLKHGNETDWNQHRSDVANLTAFVETRWQQDLGWQVVDLKAANVDDLLQSPVLFLGGRNSPLPNAPGQKQEIAQTIRDYLDRGGFLLADANCGGAGFDQGFRELMGLVFPEPEYKLRPLPPEHPVWRAEIPVPSQHMRTLLGIEFGCRTSVVYCPVDKRVGVRPSLSCLWELSRTRRDRPYGPKVQSQIDAGMAIGINVMAYATNRVLHYKDEIPRTQEKPAPGDAAQRGKLLIGNVRHPGGCNVAPRALRNLLDTFAHELDVRVVPAEEPVALTDDSLFEYHMVFMHGRNAFRLTDAERRQLKLYLERGGMLFADAICSSDPFSTSFRTEMAAIFPDRKLTPIPAQDPLLTRTYGGFDLASATRRDPQQAGNQGPLTVVLHNGPPELEGIRFDNRYGVVFSHYDVSCALEGHETLEFPGYIAQDAARIGLNVLLYSLQQ
jgi:hypothetical protein